MDKQITPSELLPGLKDKLDTKQAAPVVGLAPATLARWRIRGKGPRYVKGKGKKSPVSYRMSDLLAWIEGHVVDPEAGPTAKARKRIAK
ncbi:MAG: helix-turn-helix domain-containing protein [Candidatus Acidiferrum sp.]